MWPLPFGIPRSEAQHTVIDVGSFGGRAVALRCDITDEKSVKSAIKETAKELGGIDILVNNAANYETAEFDQLTLKQWDAIFASNTRGPFLVSREALKHLRERKGRIINMGSLGGLRPWASHAHYCSSKAAVHMLTKVMAKALAPEIAVNCIAPGMIDLGEKAAAAFMKKMAQRDSDAAKWQGRGDCRCSFVFCDCAALYYRADIGGGWRVGALRCGHAGRLTGSAARSNDAVRAPAPHVPRYCHACMFAVSWPVLPLVSRRSRAS